jgi:hypothetical protein
VRDKAHSGSPSFSNSSRQLQAIDDGHVDVAQHHIGHVKVDFIQGLGRAIRDPNIMAEQSQQFSERICYINNVIDDEDVGHRSSLNACIGCYVSHAAGLGAMMLLTNRG